MSTVKSADNRTVVATYNVANVAVFIPNVDVKVSGAINEPEYNPLYEPQADTTFTDVFSILTCAVLTSPDMIGSPDSDVACPGETLSITLAAPGSGGDGTCMDEYRYSTDNEVTWSDWSAEIPVFTAVTGTNIIRSRRACSGNCTSENNVYYWTVEDTESPTVVCQDVTINLDVDGTASIATNDVFQRGADNCGTINQVSVSPTTFDCTNLGDNTVILTVDDGHGNTANCTATVTVNDNINTCAPLPVELITFEASPK